MKKFFITGAAGFIGSHVCEHIINKFPNSKIIALDKLTYAGNKFFLKKIINNKNFTFIKSDILKTKKYVAQDDTNDCNIGDTVKIMETRPLSKSKCWRLVEILERAK